MDMSLQQNDDVDNRQIWVYNDTQPYWNYQCDEQERTDMDISINLAEDIYSLSDLQSRAKELVKKAQVTRRPLIITEGGRSVVAIVDIGEFQSLREQAMLVLDVLDIIRAERGPFTLHDEVKARYAWLFEEETDAPASN
jgi:prevent-host-death family protein